MKRNDKINPFSDDGFGELVNPYWEDMKSTGPGREGDNPVGRPKAIKDAQELWEHACDYFKYSAETPWIKTDYKGPMLQKCEYPTARPFTWGAFDEYLRSQSIIAKLEDYKSNKQNAAGVRPYDEFSEVITRIGNIIRTQKLEGAIVGAYNANIVSAELGLMNKVEVSTAKQVFRIGDQEIEIG